MRTMKTVTFSKRNKHRILHIEAPGCIINVRLVTDRDGADVTSIEVLANGNRYSGDPEWWIEGIEGATASHIRVIKTELPLSP